MSAVHVVVPDGVDDPARVSGGNVYDRRVCRELAELGWTVHEHAVPGPWPETGPTSADGLAAALAGVPCDALVLVDGLVAASLPGVLLAAARRLRLVVLMHLPSDGTGGEAVEQRVLEVLRTARAVVATSEWCRDRLLQRCPVLAGRVRVARPGADPGPVSERSPSGGRLACVASLIPAKGHDVLLAALGALGELEWTCVCVGSTVRDEAWAARLGSQATSHGLAGRVRFPGPRTGAALDATYATTDLLVHASHSESYGMVLAEALARGVPVLATSVGGVPEALGRLPDGTRPGVLVPPGDVGALAGALRRWLTDAGHREALRQAARHRRDTVPGWPGTAAQVARALAEVAR